MAVFRLLTVGGFKQVHRSGYFKSLRLLHNLLRTLQAPVRRIELSAFSTRIYKLRNEVVRVLERINYH